MFVGGALLSWPGPKVIRDQLAAFAVCLMLVGAAVVGLGLESTLLVFLIIDFVTGVVCSATSTSLTVVQSEFDAAIRGRALGVFNALDNLGMPIGMVAFGPLVDVIPVSWAFLIGGALAVPVGAWLFGYARRHPVAGSPVPGLALEQA